MRLSASCRWLILIVLGLTSACSRAAGIVVTLPPSATPPRLETPTPFAPPTLTAGPLVSATPSPTAIMPVWVTPTQTATASGTPDTRATSAVMPTATATILPTWVPQPTRSDSLQALLYAKQKRQFGVLVETESLEDPLFVHTLLADFNLVTINAVRFKFIHPEFDRYDFTNLDNLVGFAAGNGLDIRAQSLVYYIHALPDWLTQSSWPRETYVALLRDHITTIMARYRGRIKTWVVVNEAINDDGSLRDTFWLQKIGPDYLPLAYQWARAADPGATLLYNDYGLERNDDKTDAVLERLQQYRAEGVPIDGVGMQMHLELNYPRRATMQEAMQRFADAGMQVHITELDVRIKQPPDGDKLKRQSEVYYDVMQACLAVWKCRVFSMFGLTDKYSWIPNNFPGYGSAHLFDENYQPHPAYFTLLNLLTP